MFVIEFYLSSDVILRIPANSRHRHIRYLKSKLTFWTTAVFLFARHYFMVNDFVVLAIVQDSCFGRTPGCVSAPEASKDVLYFKC